MSVFHGVLEGSTPRGSDKFLQDKGARLLHLLNEGTSLVTRAQRRVCLIPWPCCGQLRWPACNDYYLALLHCSVVMTAIYQAIPWWTGFDLNARVSRCFQPAPLTWYPRRLSWKAGWSGGNCLTHRHQCVITFTSDSQKKKKETKDENLTRF